jgi:tight adherence protein B
MYNLLPIYIAVFLFAVAVMNGIPQIISWYHGRYKLNMDQTSRELRRFFFDVKPVKIIAGTVVFAVLIGLLTRSWVLAAALCLAGIFAPRLVLSFWREMRTQKVDAQLMDALILLGNAVKSGLDIAAGIDLVSANLKPPISEEFGLVINAYRLGTPLETALLDLIERIPSKMLETAVYAIILQRDTGGNIIKVFDQMIITIREENKLQKKIKALTAQGRTQIYFMAIFPWGLALLFYFASPEMMRPALATATGQIVVIGLIIWECIGLVVTKQIIAVDI